VTLGELINRWQSGDAEAFDRLYDLYAPTVYRLGWAMLRQREDAEDMVQETFLRVHRARASFDPARAAFSTWLYQIALNLCRSRLRQRHWTFVPWGEAPGQQKTIPDLAPGPEKLALRQEFQQALWSAVQRLNDRQREVIVLYYYLDLSSREIAEILGIPEGTVYSRLHHARRALRIELEVHGFVEREEPDDL
jgi:RNA polymerase sigma-70 factor (ECF subfamily)